MVIGWAGRAVRNHGETKRGKGRSKRTTSVKHGRPYPRVDAHVRPGEIEGPHRMRGMHAAAQPVRTEYVHEQVGDRERDRRGLLHPRQTPERPLAVELLHPHAALRRQVRHRVRARVLALVRARPTCEAQRERVRVAAPIRRRAGVSRAFCEATLELV